MRKTVAFIVILLSCASLSAQHWLGVSADGYMAWPTQKTAKTTAKIGGGAALGMRYQFQKNHFTIETGFGAAYCYASNTIQDAI